MSEWIDLKVTYDDGKIEELEKWFELERTSLEIAFENESHLLDFLYIFGIGEYDDAKRIDADWYLSDGDKIIRSISASIIR